MITRLIIALVFVFGLFGCQVAQHMEEVAMVRFEDQILAPSLYHPLYPIQHPGNAPGKEHFVLGGGAISLGMGGLYLGITASNPITIIGSAIVFIWGDIVWNQEYWVHVQRKAYYDLVLALAHDEIVDRTEFYLGMTREWIEDGELERRFLTRLEKDVLEQSDGRYTVFYDIVQRDTIILLDGKKERWLTFKKKGAHDIVVTPN